MPEWRAIRAAARLRREEILGADSTNELIPADELLRIAANSAGIPVCPMPPGDPLLAGAQAVLDREALCIWHRDDLPATTARFSVAHELAHWWLHSEDACCQASDVTDDPIAEPLPFAEDYVSGYSPAQRRETEANVFAAEFLLPSDAIRTAFLGSPPATYATIAALSGLSESAVLGQMAEALLISDCGLRMADSQRPSSSSSSIGINDPTTQRPNDPLTNLDDSQKAAAEVEHGPVLLSAGPGTGKTRTLVARARVLLDRGTAPESILALTFSNKAAEEMRERLALEAPLQARRLWIGTFHAFGLELLRRFGTRIGLPPVPRLMDPIDAITLLEQNLGRLNLREYEYLANPVYPFRDILSSISRAKDDLAGPDIYAALADAMPVPEGEDQASRTARRDALRAREVAEVYRVWQQILTERGMLDFGDLLFRAVELLESCPDVLAQVRGEYHDILVDEYQDINRASAVLVRSIAGEGRGLWAVGDLRQAIYRFRGASPVNLMEFERDYPGCRRLSLDVNYRSQLPLVSLFSQAATRMTGSDDKAGWTASRDVDRATVRFAEANDEEAQADGLARASRAFRSDGIAFSDQAILCRTNAQADSMALALESRGIPVLFLGKLFERPEVRDMLSLLSLACEGSAGLVRVGQFPEYDLSPSQIRDAIADTAGELNSPIRSRIAPIAFQGDAFAFLARYLFGPASYLRDLLARDDLGAHQSCVALYQLLLTARSHAARVPSADTGGEKESVAKHPQRAFLKFVRRLVAIGEDARVRLPANGDGMDAVRLMTVHASKGLEFPVVFLPNLNQYQFPPRARGSIVNPPPGLLPDSGGYWMEEERLFFVALSRARDHLVLSRPLSFRGKATTMSPLLQMIGGMLERIQVEKWALEVPRTSTKARTTPNDPATQRHDDPVTPPTHSPTRFTAQELDQYQRCPRQYYYARVWKLRDSVEESAFRAFQKVLWKGITWIRDGQHERENRQPQELASRFTALWESEGPPAGHPHEPILRERAIQMLEQVAAFDSKPSAQPASLRAHLTSGIVTVEPEQFEMNGDQAIVERWYTGRPRNDDRDAPRIALLREAVRQTHGVQSSVRLRYLSTGDVVEVHPRKRLEAARLNRYETAMRGIRNGEFGAAPSNACARCPFFFICPA